MKFVRRRRVLLADDDSEDRLLFEEAFRNRNDIELLPSMVSGVDIVDLLKATEDPEMLPDLIILDQNMPKMNGKQTLAFIKSHSRFARIVVVVYTTYTDRRLVEECLDLGASMVVAKPITSQGYQSMMDGFLDFLDRPGKEVISHA